MKKKLYIFLSAFEKDDPIAYDTVCKRVASIIGRTVQAVKRQAKAAKAAKDDAQTSEGPDLDEAIEGIFFMPPDLYYSKSGTRNEYEPHRERDIIRKLAERGLSRKGTQGEPSGVDRAILAIQEKHSVHYAGPQTAHRVGLHTCGESSFLVTREPNFIVPCQGDPGPFMELTDHLCGVGQDPEGEMQKNILLGWFQQWFRALDQPGSFIPGQILAFGGPPSIGKNCYAYFTGLLGGSRVYEPGKNSNFNGELIGSTLEVSHDSAFPESGAQIREYWQKRKALVANHEHRIEKKNLDARTMPLAGIRCMVTFNLAEEAMKVVPPMVLENGMEDKIHLLRAYGSPTPYPQQGTPEGKAWVAMVCSSLSAFIWYVQNEFVLPPELRDNRYGVATYHNPEIVALIKRNHPDRYLAEAIDRYFESHSGNPTNNPSMTVTVSGPLVGTASDIYIILRAGCEGTFDSVCKSPQQMGHQLPRIKKELPGWATRITEETIWKGPDHKQESRQWTITAAGATT
jgi:hypothetical protein